MKTLKKVLIGFAAFVLIAAVSVVLIFQFYIKPKYSHQILSAVNALLEDEEVKDSLQSVLEDETVKNDIQDMLQSEEIQNALKDVKLPEQEKENPAASVVPQKTPAIQQRTPEKKDNASIPVWNPKNNINPIQQEPEKQQPSAPTANEGQVSEEKPSVTEQPEQSYEDKMAAAKEQITPKDMAEGMKLAGKIDIGYVSGLMSGGLTPEKKKEAKEYLNKKLTSDEIKRLKILVAKYSYLLE